MKVREAKWTTKGFEMPRHQQFHQVTITSKDEALNCRILFSQLPSCISGLTQEPRTSLQNVSLGMYLVPELRYLVKGGKGFLPCVSMTTRAT